MALLDDIIASINAGRQDKPEGSPIPEAKDPAPEPQKTEDSAVQDPAPDADRIRTYSDEFRQAYRLS